MDLLGQRRVIISGNWKMNKTRAQSLEFFDVFLKSAQFDEAISCIVFPSATTLETCTEAVSGTPVQIGSQNVHWADSGAFTGELSTEMLSEIQIQTALIGHSERRQYFGETNETVAKRAVFALSKAMQVMVCIGESLEQRDQGHTEKVLHEQIDALFDRNLSIAPFLDGRVMIAYEPVWAIGTGKSATPEMAQEAHLLIRDRISKCSSAAQAAQTPILYGGSVKAENIESLLRCPDIDGALIGGASLDPNSFASILNRSLELYGELKTLPSET